MGLPHTVGCCGPLCGEVEGKEGVGLALYGVISIGSNQCTRTARGIWRLCCANLSSFPMSMLTKPAPQGLLLGALIIILPATLWHSAFMLQPGNQRKDYASQDRLHGSRKDSLTSKLARASPERLTGPA
eukprot:1149201-Pelagomonas_calceolata.AAC.1